MTKEDMTVLQAICRTVNDNLDEWFPDVRPRDIFKKTRQRPVVIARNLYRLYIRSKHPRISLDGIAAKSGRQHHSTVIHSLIRAKCTIAKRSPDAKMGADILNAISDPATKKAFAAHCNRDISKVKYRNYSKTYKERSPEERAKRLKYYHENADRLRSQSAHRHRVISKRKKLGYYD